MTEKYFFVDRKPILDCGFVKELSQRFSFRMCFSSSRPTRTNSCDTKTGLCVIGSILLACYAFVTLLCKDERCLSKIVVYKIYFCFNFFFYTNKLVLC